MINFFLTDNTYTNGYLANMLHIITLIASFCGVLVISINNPVVSVLFLIGVFGTIASYLIILGLNFLGFVYLVVYIGAISILFLFIIMLMNIRISELVSNTWINTVPLGIYTTIALSYNLFNLLPYDVAILSNNYYMNNIFYGLAISNFSYLSFYNSGKVDVLYDNQLAIISSNMWDGNLADTGHIESIGSVMYTNFNMWLLEVSFILLLAMVGVLVIVFNPYVSNLNKVATEKLL